MYMRKRVPSKTYNSVKQKSYPEKYLENWTGDRAAEHGWKDLKFYSRVDTGWMDRIYLSPKGATIWVEFKKPTGKLAPLQKVNRIWLISNFHVYYCLDTYEKCVWFATEILPNY